MSIKKQDKQSTNSEMDQFDEFICSMIELHGTEKTMSFIEEGRRMESETVAGQRRAKLQEFVDSLLEMPASFQTSAEFDAQWENLLVFHEVVARDFLTVEIRKLRSAESLVKRGWFVLDRNIISYECQLNLPPAESESIAVVLVNTHGQWVMPYNLMLTLANHPKYRALSATLPNVGSKESLLHKLKLAKTHSESNDPNEAIISTLAAKIEALMDEKILDYHLDTGWLGNAKKNEQFWQLLSYVFDLGRRCAIWDIYKDGTLAKESRKGKVMKKGPSDWRIFIADELKAIRLATGQILTPAKLRASLGAELPGVDDDPMAFKDPRCTSMPPITWPEFQNRAKKARQKLDL